MEIQELYKRYHIMPNLREHQLRVAGVAQIICDSMKNSLVDMEHVVSACLLHDMGNIIKFRLELFPAFLKPEGLDYWKKVQSGYIAKYGHDEHVATLEIAKEILSTDSGFMIHDSQRILELLHAVGFSNARQNFETDDFGKKIAAYADMRVMPFDVRSMTERLDDGRKRFTQKKKPFDQRHFDDMSGYLYKIEDQIFSQSSIKPFDITEDIVQKIILKLRSVFHTQPNVRKDHSLH